MRLSFLPSLIVGSAIFATTAAQAQSNQTCTLKNNYCVPFVGCIAERNLVIFGQSYGRHKGQVFGMRSDNVPCRGKWRRTTFGGKVQFHCADGLKGRVRYNVLDKPTGTVSGRGRNSDGSSSRFWSGTKIFQFLATDKSVAKGFAQCGEVLLRNFSN